MQIEEINSKDLILVQNMYTKLTDDDQLEL